MPEPDHNLEAVKIAGEWNKQLGLWATGSVVVSITFIKDLMSGARISTCWRDELGLGWGILVLSVLVGHFAYGAPLTGAGKDAAFSLKVTQETRTLSIIQASLFVIGMACLVVFALFNLPLNVPGGTH